MLCRGSADEMTSGVLDQLAQTTRTLKHMQLFYLILACVYTYLWGRGEGAHHGPAHVQLDRLGLLPHLPHPHTRECSRRHREWECRDSFAGQKSLWVPVFQHVHGWVQE